MKGIDTFPRRGEVAQRILDQNKPAYAREPVSKPQAVVPKDECPKCGKRIGRGRWMHIKNCKG
jgi:hypothetical protein